MKKPSGVPAIDRGSNEHRAPSQPMPNYISSLSISPRRLMPAAPTVTARMASSPSRPLFIQTLFGQTLFGQTLFGQTMEP